MADLERERAIGSIIPGFVFADSHEGWTMRFDDSGMPSYIEPENILGGDYIATVNRTFDQVNEELGGKLSKALIYRTHSEALEPVSTLDVGGGFSSNCARQIADMFGDLVKVTTLDVLHDIDHEDPRIVRVTGSAIQMNIASESQDLVYSSNMLMYFSDTDFLQALSEIARVLRPGGEAILHDEVRDILEFTDNQAFVALKRRLGVTMWFHPAKTTFQKLITMHKPV